MFKLGLLTVALGAVGLLVWGGLIAYTQAGSGDNVVEKTYELLRTPRYQAVVATVNGVAIDRERVEIVLAGFEAQVALTPPGVEPPSSDQAPNPREALDVAIKQDLIYQEALRRELPCTDAEVQEIADTMFGDAPSDLLEPWAGYLGVPADQLMRHPEVIEYNTRLCLGAKLAEDVLPPDTRVSSPEGRPIWDSFIEALRQSAEIEILEPALR